jgi:hypothetical protein
MSKWVWKESIKSSCKLILEALATDNYDVIVKNANALLKYVEQIKLDELYDDSNEPYYNR